MGNDAKDTADYRGKELEHALIGMVLQYCTEGTADGGMSLCHAWMGAEEEAFETLGIGFGDSADILYARSEELEKEMIPGFAESRGKRESTAWEIVRGIIRRGNDAVIRKKGDGFVVMEDKRTIKYKSSD